MTRFLQLIRATVVALFILTASQSVFALLAENGWYWNTSESGRGFNIEIQNNLLFMSGLSMTPQETQFGWLPADQ